MLHVIPCDGLALRVGRADIRDARALFRSHQRGLLVHVDAEHGLAKAPMADQHPKPSLAYKPTDFLL